MGSIKEVADRAAVSVGTVSNVLNRPWVVALDKRHRVQKAIADIGYVPNSAARRLRAGNRHSVGVVIDDLRAPGRSELVAGVADALESTGRHVLLHSAGGNAARFLAHAHELGSEGVRAALVCISPTLLAAPEATVSFAHAVHALRRLQITSVVIDVSSPTTDLHLGALNAHTFTIATTVDDLLEACLAHLAEQGQTQITLVGSTTLVGPLARRIRPLARSAGLRISTAKPEVSRVGVATAVVLCDNAAVAAYAAAPVRSRPKHAVALSVDCAVGAVGLAYADAAAYDMGKVAVDIMLTDPDPMPTKGAGLRLPAVIIRATPHRPPMKTTTARVGGTR